MILSYQTLLSRYSELIPRKEDQDVTLINPASIDIRVGSSIFLDGTKIDISQFNQNAAFRIVKGDFVLVETQEVMRVPLDLAMEMKLKSSRAREGYDHSLAFWFDPGWLGKGTMELQCHVSKLPLYPGLRIAQIIYHKLDEVCQRPYNGKYNGAIGVEQAKPDNIKQ